MANLDLRPLSLGEILDRTFSIYRRNFLLFLGIAALPQVLLLGFRLAEVALLRFPAMSGTGRAPAEQFQSSGAQAGLLAFGFFGLLIGIVLYLVVYLFSQGGTMFAVSDLYLGRPTSIRTALGRMRGNAGNLFGVMVLSGLAIMGSALLFLIPGIYVACRLLACIPAALLEDLGASESLRRSFELTKDFAGRAFTIYFIYFCILYGAVLLFAMPFAIATGVSAAANPEMARLWLILSQVGESIGAILATPVLTIATAVFYYDLRVRKEAFDLQMLMNPSAPTPSGTASVPTMLS